MPITSSTAKADNPFFVSEIIHFVIWCFSVLLRPQNSPVSTTAKPYLNIFLILIMEALIEVFEKYQIC